MKVCCLHFDFVHPFCVHYINVCCLHFDLSTLILVSIKITTLCCLYFNLTRYIILIALSFLQKHNKNEYIDKETEGKLMFR